MSTAVERLTYSQRKDLPDSAFALPELRRDGKGGLPLTDKSGRLDPVHVRNAASRLAQMHKRGAVTSGQYVRARRKIERAACKVGVEKTCATHLGEAKDNPLSGAEKTTLVVVGVVAVAVIGGVIYVAMKPAAAATTTPGTTTTNTPPGTLLPANMQSNPSTQVTAGNSYAVAAVISGRNMQTGDALPGQTAMSKSDVMAALGPLGWSNVHLIYWGPDGTIDDPNGFMSRPELGQLQNWKGTYLFTSTYTGIPLNLQGNIGISAYKIG